MKNEVMSMHERGRDHYPLMTERPNFCSSGSVRVADEKSSPGSREERHVKWDIYEYVLTISRTPTLDASASTEAGEAATSAVLLYGGDVLSVEDMSTLHLRASRVQALRGSPLSALRGDLQRYAASSGTLDSKGRRTNSAARVEGAFGEHDVLSVEDVSISRLHACNNNLTPARPQQPPRHPRVQALRGSPLDALRGELQRYAASSGTLDSKGRRTDSATRVERAFGEHDVLSVEDVSTLRLRACNNNLTPARPQQPPRHPRVQALRGSPLNALRGELQRYAASSGTLDSKGRRTDSATRVERAFGECESLFTRKESLLVNDFKDQGSRDRTRAPPPPPPMSPSRGGSERHLTTPPPPPRRRGVEA